ncbi:MAG: type I glutamate--ammonia ligase [Candidatus Micrarchaeota archaeon]|nr:type I glutamate--ammonia ligase [Candidatus Micrarchaeota archaeon]
MERHEKSKTIVERAKKDGVQFVDLEFVDIMGTTKACEITVEKLEGACNEGLWFDGSSIEGFARICESDMYLVPDLDSYAVMPWSGGRVARIMCDVYSDEGKPFEGDPRNVLRRMLKKAEEKGFEFKVGPELEFFLFTNGDAVQKLRPHDDAGYFDLGVRDEADEVRRQVVTHLDKIGLRVEMNHHECAPGQHEIDFTYGPALKIADYVQVYKTAVRTIAKGMGLHASFMPKPLEDVNGSGMHVHQSLWKSEKNAFFDENGRYKLSKTAEHYIAGQLAHARALAAIVAPTVNSYKRLVPGFEAPVYVCWGQVNRSALIRIPRYKKGREGSVRCEFRAPDPSANPYLAFAAMLAAGLDGIERKLEPPNPIEENVYRFSDEELEKKGIPLLPNSLHSAFCELEKDKVLQEALGKHVYEKLVESQKREWADYKRHVTKWEIDRYFGVL